MFTAVSASGAGCACRSYGARVINPPSRARGNSSLRVGRVLSTRPGCRSVVDAPKEVIVTLVALLSSIVICSASLAWGFAQQGFTSFSTWIIIFGAGWLLAVWQDWRWYSSVALFLATVLAALGLWFGFTPG